MTGNRNPFDEQETTVQPGPRRLVEALVGEFGLPLGFRGTSQASTLENGLIPTHSSGNSQYPNCYVISKEAVASEGWHINLILERILNRSICDVAKEDAQKDQDLFSKDPSKRYEALGRNLPVFYVFGEDRLEKDQTGITYGKEGSPDHKKDILIGHSGDCRATDSGIFIVTEREFEKLLPAIKAHSNTMGAISRGHFFEDGEITGEDVANIGYAFRLFKEVIHAKMLQQYNLLNQ